MNNKELIAKEIEQIPDPLLEEVLDFVRFLKSKSAESAQLNSPRVAVFARDRSNDSRMIVDSEKTHRSLLLRINVALG